MPTERAEGLPRVAELFGVVHSIDVRCLSLIQVKVHVWVA